MEKVRLYVQSMAKDDLEVKRKEPKSNQSALPAAVMETAPAASKPAAVAEKIVDDSEAIEKKRSGFSNPEGL